MTIRLILAGVFLSVLSVSSAHAQMASESSQPPDPTECLISVAPLEALYRPTLQRECLRLAGDSCATYPDAVACIAALNETLYNLYSDMSADIPVTIEGTDAEQATHAEKLRIAAEVFGVTSECARHQGVSKEVCIYQAFSGQVMQFIGMSEAFGTWP